MLMLSNANAGGEGGCQKWFLELPQAKARQLMIDFQFFNMTFEDEFCCELQKLDLNLSFDFSFCPLYQNLL